MTGENGLKDWLDERLSQPEPHVDDDGFSAQLMARLPPPPRSRERLRAGLLLASTGTAGVIAWPGARLVFKALTIAPTWSTLTQPLPLCAVVLLLLAGCGAMAAATSE